ncbi:uncharacterized protein Z520_08532 [Fonsecaea multimorphosa CBS 102226]|uniref:Myb-like domain-containing protein n=1 Tax=Fonsecaea multimorphosa CBS 102226 TaxID=1442371 RepID=A0A0D2JZ41_9EURO|nr:uncharacterized protein Z520_08532 [Fonsecaea multimorphosa CBS 102226]KIX95824.1 hypothetical protein Z520_08532 [Fonsecaea multimorphosa CBS 102226]OAL21559.1 hypothetical protein AYO22_07955 [Fonsecaea multimorphosa]
MTSRPRLRSSSRKNTPLSPPKPTSISVVIDAPPNHNRRRTRSVSQQVAAAQQLSQELEQGLPTVAEERPPSERVESVDSSISVSIEEGSTGSSIESLLDSLDRNAIIDNLVKLRNDSDGIFSMFEGDEKNRAADVCAKLLKLDPLLHRKLSRREEQLLATMEAYGGSPDFINPEIVIRKILDDSGLRKINNGPWRPDGVLYLANLALQMVRVLSRSLEERHTYLELMFNNFPAPFHGLDPFISSPDMLKGTFHCYIEILTQFYIRQVEIKHHEEGFDPDEYLGNVFYDGRYKIKGSSDEATYAKAMSRMSSIKSHFNTEIAPYINIEALRQQFPWSDFAVQVVRWSLARKKELDEVINSRGGIEKLIDTLLAEDFQDEAALANRLSQGPELAGLNKKEQDPVRGDIQAEQVEHANNQSTSLKQKAATGSLSGKAMKANIDRLKALKVQHSTRHSGSKITQVAPNSPEPEHEIPRSPSPFVNETQPGAIDGGDSQTESLPQAAASDEEIVPTQQTNIVLETVRRQNEQSDKENKNQPARKASLLDRQKGAERVEWSEPSDNEDTPRQLPKRRRPQTVEIDAGPDEFETDKRATKRVRASGEIARRQSRTTRPSLPAEEENTTTTSGQDARLSDKSRTVAFANRGQPSRLARAVRSRSPEAVQRALSIESSQPSRSGTRRSPSDRAPLESVPAAQRLPSSSAPTRTHLESFRSSRQPSEAPPLASQIDRVNQEAKARMRMSRELAAPRGSQVRIPYTQDEVERLMEMIALHETSWAMILKEDRKHKDGPMLQRRTQVQLKDKARNLKLDFLKARAPLPPGFEKVGGIGEKKIAELKALGIDYVQAHEDGAQDPVRYTKRRRVADAADSDDEA